MEQGCLVVIVTLTKTNGMSCEEGSSKNDEKRNDKSEQESVEKYYQIKSGYYMIGQMKQRSWA